MSESNKLRPNSFQTPNLIVDRLMPLLENGELRVLLFATRHIYGWPETNAAGRERLSITAFERGHRGSKGCGLGRPAIISALGNLEMFGVMKRDGKPTRKGQLWGLADHQDEIDWEGLEQRARSQKDKARRQTAKASRAPRRKPVRSTNQSSGSSIEPGDGSPDVPVGGSSNEPESGTSNERIETQSLKPILETHDPSSTTGSLDSAREPAAVSPNGGAAASRSTPIRSKKSDTVPKALMDPMKDAIASAFGWSWTTMTDSEKGTIQRAAKELCKAGVAPCDIPGLHRYCASRWGKEFGPMALASNLSAYRKNGGSNERTKDDVSLAARPPSTPQPGGDRAADAGGTPARPGLSPELLAIRQERARRAHAEYEQRRRGNTQV